MKDFSDNNNIDGSSNFSVKLRKNENVESLIRRFIKKTKKEKIIEDVMDRQHYEKPAVKRRKEASRRKAMLTKLREKEKLEMLTDD